MKPKSDDSRRDKLKAVDQVLVKELGPGALAQAVLVRFHPKGHLKLRFAE